MTCPRCGAPAPSGAKFCNQCAAPLTAGPSVPSTAPVTAPSAAPAGAPPALPSATALVLHHHGPAQRSLHYLALAALGIVMLFLSAIVLGILREQARTLPGFIVSLVMAVLPVPIYA